VWSFVSSVVLMLRSKKLLKSANAARSYSKNNSGTFSMDHGVLRSMSRNKMMHNKIACDSWMFALAPAG